MTTISIPGFIQAEPAQTFQRAHFQGMRLNFYEYENMKLQGLVLVCPYTMEINIPAGWDPRPDQVKALQAKRAEFAAAMMSIDRQIANLLSIENAA